MNRNYTLTELHHKTIELCAIPSFNALVEKWAKIFLEEKKKGSSLSDSLLVISIVRDCEEWRRAGDLFKDIFTSEIRAYAGRSFVNARLTRTTTRWQPRIVRKSNAPLDFQTQWELDAEERRLTG